MELITLLLPSDFLSLSDNAIGWEVRRRMQAAINEKQGRYSKGFDSARKKLGHQITIDGVTYDSKEQARKALGLTKYTFQKLYG